MTAVKRATSARISATPSAGGPTWLVFAAAMMEAVAVDVALSLED